MEVKEWIDSEIKKYQEIETKICFGIGEIADKVSNDELNKRFFVKKVQSLRDYLKLLEATRLKCGKKKFFGLIKSDDSKHLNEINFKKESIVDDLAQVEKCSNCKCLNCTLNCPFSSCRECSPRIYVAGCDKQRYVILKGYKNVVLYCEDTDEDIEFEVVGLLHDSQDNKEYIYLSEVCNSDNQQLLGYKKDLSGRETYYPLESEEQLNLIYEIFLRYDIFK